MKISVYITNHNYGRYLKRSIESVLNQNFNDFELIIIDDGSKDNSREIIEQYSNNNQIKIIYQEKKGLNISNNIAINISSGEYLMRLDADDFLDKNALNILSNTLDNNQNAALVFSDYYIIDDSEEIINIERRHDFKKSVSLLDQPAHGACTMFRKSMLVEVGGYWTNFDRQDGFDIWLKLINSYEIENVNLPLFYYRQHSKNLTKDKLKLYKTRYNIIEKNVKLKKETLALDTLAIIPMRGLLGKKCLELKKFNKTTLIEKKINQLLNTKNIKKIIISTNNKYLLNYVKSKFDDIVLDHRPRHLTNFNVRIEKTLDHIFENYNKIVNGYTNIVTVNVETPFIKSFYIDKAINVLNLFKVDSVIAVTQENSSFFKHKGKGMESLFNNNNTLRVEKDIIYKKVGGIEAFKTSLYKKSHKKIGKKIGHILVDEFSSFSIDTELKWTIAEFLETKLEK